MDSLDLSMINPAEIHSSNNSKSQVSILQQIDKFDSSMDCQIINSFRQWEACQIIKAMRLSLFWLNFSYFNVFLKNKLKSYLNP